MLCAQQKPKTKLKMKTKIIKILKQARNIGYSNGEIANEILKVFQSQLKERDEALKVESELIDWLYDKIHTSYEDLQLGHTRRVSTELGKIIEDRN